MTTNEIEKLRTDMGLTVAQFAAMFGVTRQTAHNWIAGRTVPAGPALKLLEHHAGNK